MENPTLRNLDFAPVENPAPRRLASAQIDFYNEHGYVKPFRVFDDAAAAANRAYFDRLLAEVSAQGGRDQYSINGFHLGCAGIWDLATNPLIVDYVEDILGPDFVCWGTHFFCKLPHDPNAVPWHQDASYWPLEPARTVTVWLAIDDADEENSAMQFLPGTHRLGHLKWRQARGPVVLWQEIEGVENLGEPVFDELKAGEFSLHADMLAHGSTANSSNRRRCGLTMRYCPVTVRSDQGWNRNAILCRGSDPSGHWANNPRPVGDDTNPATWGQAITANAGG